MGSQSIRWFGGILLPVCLMLFFVLLSFSACGKKGPPIPPDQPVPPAATPLILEMEEGRVILRWTPDRTNDAIVGYAVYRASYPLSEPACPACHQNFHKIDSLDVPDNAEDMSYLDVPPAGLQYTYKVRPYDDDGEIGLDSFVVAVDVP
jgi:predicted small lipoprotein YifL